MGCNNGGGSGGSGGGGSGNGTGQSLEVGYAVDGYLPDWPEQTEYTAIKTTDGKTWTLVGKLSVVDPRSNWPAFPGVNPEWPTYNGGEWAAGQVNHIAAKQDGSLVLVFGNDWIKINGGTFNNPIHPMYRAGVYGLFTAGNPVGELLKFPVDLLFVDNPDYYPGIYNPMLQPHDRGTTTDASDYPYWHGLVTNAPNLWASAEFDGQILVSTYTYKALYSTTDGRNWTLWYHDPTAYVPGVWGTNLVGGRTWGFHRMMQGLNGYVVLLAPDGPYYLAPGSTAPVKGTLTGFDVDALARTPAVIPESWGWDYTMPCGFAWFELKYYNGQYIALGQSPLSQDNYFYVATSQDAITWNIQQATLPEGNFSFDYGQIGSQPEFAFTDGHYYLLVYKYLDYRENNEDVLIQSTNLIDWSFTSAPVPRQIAWPIGSVNGTMVTVAYDGDTKDGSMWWGEDPRPSPISSPTWLAYTETADLNWQAATYTGPMPAWYWEGFNVIGPPYIPPEGGDGFPSAPPDPECNDCTWTGKARAYRPHRSVTQSRARIFSGKKSIFDEV